MNILIAAALTVLAIPTWAYNQCAHQVSVCHKKGYVDFDKDNRITTIFEQGFGNAYFLINRRGKYYRCVLPAYSELTSEYRNFLGNYGDKVYFARLTFPDGQSETRSAAIHPDGTQTVSRGITKEKFYEDLFGPAEREFEEPREVNCLAYPEERFQDRLHQITLEKIHGIDERMNERNAWYRSIEESVRAGNYDAMVLSRPEYVAQYIDELRGSFNQEVQTCENARKVCTKDPMFSANIELVPQPAGGTR